MNKIEIKIKLYLDYETNFKSKEDFVNHITKNIKMLLGTWDLGYEKSFTKSEIKKILEKTGFELEKYWVEPHIQIANPFNLFDNILNKLR